MSPQGVRERVVEPYRTHMAATIAHESRPQIAQELTLESTYDISTSVETEYAVAGPAW